VKVHLLDDGVGDTFELVGTPSGVYADGEYEIRSDVNGDGFDHVLHQKQAGSVALKRSEHQNGKFGRGNVS
jgi:hypothetical protein